jgi:hypothetical protein
MDEALVLSKMSRGVSSFHSTQFGTLPRVVTSQLMGPLQERERPRNRSLRELGKKSVSRGDLYVAAPAVTLTTHKPQVGLSSSNNMNMGSVEEGEEVEMEVEGEEESNGIGDRTAEEGGNGMGGMPSHARPYAEGFWDQRARERTLFEMRRRLRQRPMIKPIPRHFVIPWQGYAPIDAATFSVEALSVIAVHTSLAANGAMGYLGGSYDTKNQHMHITMALPMMGRIEEADMNARVEFANRRLFVVGYYHTRMRGDAPDLGQFDCLLHQQMRLVEGSVSILHPFVSALILPYEPDVPLEEISVLVYESWPTHMQPIAPRFIQHQWSIDRGASLTMDNVLLVAQSTAEFLWRAKSCVDLLSLWQLTFVLIPKGEVAQRTKYWEFVRALPEGILTTQSKTDVLVQRAVTRGEKLRIILARLFMNHATEAESYQLALLVLLRMFGAMQEPEAAEGDVSHSVEAEIAL